MNTSRTWEETDFRDEVVRFVREDIRFQGLAEYLSQVRICWSYFTTRCVAGHGFMFFNPDWWDTLPEETRKAVVFSMAYQLIARHMQRKEGLNPHVFSMASAYAANMETKNMGFTNAGWAWLYDDRFSGWSAESIYLDLMDGDVHVPTFIFENEIPNDIIEEMIEHIMIDEDLDLEDQIKSDEIRSTEAGASYGIGDGTGSVGLDFGIAMTNEVIIGATFEEILDPYMGEPVTTKHRSYKRPSRRSSTGDFILPSRMSKTGEPERLKHLVYLLDVSGSISEEMGKQSNNAVQTIKHILDPELMTVIFYDTQIKLEKTFTDKEKYTPLKVRAGGGTNLGPVYKRLRKLQPEAVLNFTDLQVGIPPEPEWETIWLVPESGVSIPANLYGKVYLIPKKDRKLT